ncbi:MAG: cysteine desulfurase family protein [Filomicrobium sp.]
MTGLRTYLDHNATTPLRPSARDAMIAALDRVGNPSSVHGEGRRARAVVEKARAQVAAMVGCLPRNIVFTSGATEANATVIGQSRWASVAAAGVEHPSVMVSARRHGDRFTELPVDHDGQVELAAIRDWLDATVDGNKLLSVQWANNETGVLQPIVEIADLVAEAGAFLHVDAVQAVGREAVDVSQMPISYLTLSSHKIGGPMGAGAIVQGCDGEIKTPLIPGGGQEHNLRAGTENVAGLAGFGAAAVEASVDLAQVERLRSLRDSLEKRLPQLSPDCVVLGANAPRLPNTTAIAVPGMKAETMVIAFDLAGFAVSSGSACSSGKVGRSAVVDAMGLPPELGQGMLRISLGWTTDETDIERFLKGWTSVVKSKCSA